jgi:predicted Zn finger-like uncharacterized protein
MPIEVSCPSCAGQFRVPDAAAGKKIRCPKCKGAMDVPALSAAPRAPAEAPEFVPPSPAPRSAPAEPTVSMASAAPAKPAPPKSKAAAPAAKPQPKAEHWFLKTEEGDEYGPVPRDELDAWRAEGRITADCQLLREGTDQWQWASDVYVDLSDADAVPAAAPVAKTKQTDAKKSQKAPAQEPADAGPPSTRSRLVAGLLGIFLGPLGTHRFYLGYWVIGLVMLATGGGCGVWSLVDAVLIFLGKVPDADGRPLL